MSIENFKHLFVPITKRLPKHKGYYLVIDENYKPWIENFLCFDPYNNKWTNDYGDEFHPQYWLDLSILTINEDMVKNIQEVKRLSVSDILVDPNATLNVGKLDFNDPRVIEIMENAKKEQKAILALKNITQEDLNKEITI